MTPAEDERAAIAERLAWVVGKVNRRLRPPADTLTHVAVSALGSIGRAGSVRPGDLARIEGIAAPGMTRLVADLEQRGLVERRQDPDDGRSTLVRLTAAGERGLADARRARARSVRELIEDCSPADLAALRSAVAVLEAALARVTPAATGHARPDGSAERGLHADREGVDPLPDHGVGAPAVLDAGQQA
jgi:DNA-binding MarR family transcriptional regulator